MPDQDGPTNDLESPIRSVRLAANRALYQTDPAVGDKVDALAKAASNGSPFREIVAKELLLCGEVFIGRADGVFFAPEIIDVIVEPYSKKNREYRYKGTPQLPAKTFAETELFVLAFHLHPYDVRGTPQLDRLDAMTVERLKSLVDNCAAIGR